MLKIIRWKGLPTLILASLAVTGCASRHAEIDSADVKQSTKASTYPLSERVCLERAMFFESRRSSRAGMIAVGTVVMNRVNSSAYPHTICGVVGQPKQFAPGVLTRPMDRDKLPDVREAADAVLKGERDKKLKNAMFFHTAGLKFPYKNMHYVQVAGGNAFYEKRSRSGALQVPVNDQPYNVALAFAQEGRNSPVYDMLRRPADRGVGFNSVATAKAEYKPVAFEEPTGSSASQPAVGQGSMASATAITSETSLKLPELPSTNVPVPVFADSLAPRRTATTVAINLIADKLPSAKKMEEIGALLVAQQERTYR